MFKKLFMLFKIGRKLSTSGVISSIYEIYNPPITIKILFFVIGFSFIDKKNNNKIFVNKYPKQGSGIISSIAFTDGIIEIPEEVSQINKGDQYKLYLFSDLFA